MSWNDLVFEVMPEIPKSRRGHDFARYLLWNHTAFPFSKEGYIRAQLEEFRADAGDVRRRYIRWRDWNARLQRDLRRGKYGEFAQRQALERQSREQNAPGC